MGNTEQYDYVIEECRANGRTFIEAPGCVCLLFLQLA